MTSGMWMAAHYGDRQILFGAKSHGSEREFHNRTIQEVAYQGVRPARSGTVPGAPDRHAPASPTGTPGVLKRRMAEDLEDGHWGARTSNPSRRSAPTIRSAISTQRGVSP